MRAFSRPSLFATLYMDVPTIPRVRGPVGGQKRSSGSGPRVFGLSRRNKGKWGWRLPSWPVGKYIGPFESREAALENAEAWIRTKGRG